MTKTRKTLGLLFTGCACLIVSIQPTLCQRVSTLAGTVTDSVTRRPVPDASIVVVGTTLGSSADSAGRYIVRRVPQGSQTLLIRHVAYNQATQKLVVPADADTVILNISLLPTVLPLPGVTALGEMRLDQPVRESYKRWARVVISAKQLEEERLIDFDQFLHWHAPLAENEYELFVDGSRFPTYLRDIIKISNIKEIFVWRRMDAPIEFKLNYKELPESRVRSVPAEGLRFAPRNSVLSDPFIIKPYIILIVTK